MTPDSKTDVKHAPPKGPRRISLRAFLSLVMLALSLLTVGGMGLIAYSRSYDSLTMLKQREFAVANSTAAGEIRRLLDDPALRIFDEYTHRAQLGILPVHDTLALGREFAERLRAHPQLAWISYSDAATGDFTGVRRDEKNGDIIINRASQSVNRGLPAELLVGRDGSLAPHETTPDWKEPYDPRESDWYLQAAKSNGTAWSAPYDFGDGVYGITASQAWRANGSQAVTGVFTVDFFLADLEREMGELSLEQRDFVCMFQMDGTLLCAPKTPGRWRSIVLLGRALKQASDSPDARQERLLTVKQDGVQYLVALHYLKTSTGLECVVANLARTSDVYQVAMDTAEKIAATGLILLCVALAAGWGIAKRISRPLGILSGDLQKVGEFDLTPGPLKKSIFREVHILIESSERMKSGLRSFLRYVPGDLVRQLLRSGRDATLGVEPRMLTIFFSDIENFTGYSERVPPGRLVLDLSGYFTTLRRVVREHSGTIDKFIGDGMLAFFNAPADVPGHERLACESALAALGELQPARTAEGALGSGAAPLPFRTRIGLHTGEVLVGNVGTPERFAYTVLGDAVNATSRIESLNKIYGTSILASGEVRDRAGGHFEWRHVDRVAVAGRSGTINIHELLGVKGGAIDPEILRARNLHEQALVFYFAQNLARARELFTEAAAARPGDKASQVMARRCEDLINNRPGESWDGVFVHKHK